MARQALVVDASVGVKWFSDKDEVFLPQALSIRDKHLAGQLIIIVPDLFYYEVTNAIVNKKHIPFNIVQDASEALFKLGFLNAAIDTSLLLNSIQLARQLNITVYDACYMALARTHDCPLITANPRHQVPLKGCNVIPLEQWGNSLNP